MCVSDFKGGWNAPLAPSEKQCLPAIAIHQCLPGELFLAVCCGLEFLAEVVEKGVKSGGFVAVDEECRGWNLSWVKGGIA